MVESLKELNEICQKPRYRETGNWMVRTLLRDAALPVTWLLLHTSVSANQVTLAALGVGIIGLFLLALPAKACFLAGMLLLQFWYLLDHVDGQIARYRKTVSLSGRFFDFLMHHVIHGIFFFVLGWSLFLLTETSFFLFWGFAASFTMTSFNLLQDTKYKTFFEKLVSAKNISIRQDTGKKTSASSAGKSPARLLFSFLHKSIEMHVCMNVYTAAALLMTFFSAVPDLRFPLFFYYGLTAPFCFVLKALVWIKDKKIDAEFDSTFEISGDPHTP